MNSFWNGFEKRASASREEVMKHIKSFNDDPAAYHLGKAEYEFKDGHHLMKVSRGPKEVSYLKPTKDGKFTLVL